MPDPTNPDDEAALAANVKKLRERMAVQVAEIKAAIMAWLKPREEEMDNVCVTMALLELAFDRHIAIHDENGFDLIESAYRRALQRWRGTLQ